MKELAFDFETLDFSQIGQWPKKVKGSLLFILFIISLYFGYVMLIEESWLELHRSETQCLVLQQELANTAKQFSNREFFKDQSGQIGLSLEVLNRQLPAQNEEAKLLENIAEQALQCRLKIRMVKPQPEQYKECYVENPIIISMTGDFHGLGEFASHLSSMSPIITLEDYSLQYNKAGETLDMQLLLKTYRSVNNTDKKQSDEDNNRNNYSEKNIFS